MIRAKTTSNADEINPVPIRWGAHTPAERGPVIATLTEPRHRNVLGAHAGPYSVYGALAVAAGVLDPGKRPDLTDTEPTDDFGPHPQWFEPDKIVSLDPWGANVTRDFRTHLAEGYDIRPTIAVTKAHVSIPEVMGAMLNGRLKADGKILKDNGTCVATKVAIEPVWHLPGVARRFKVSEEHFRRTLFEQTGGMFPDLRSRMDLEVFLPPVGGQTVYIFGNPKDLSDPDTMLTARVHDECNGSDVFGSDICTCRPYLMHGAEEAIRCAQKGGVGLLVYSRKEGKASGEVTKFLIYNKRKRQEGGDTAARYFECTESVAGVQDARFQQLMPDVLHWLGIRRIHRLVSMSNYKFDAIVESGIEVLERVPIPPQLVPEDAQVEIQAKIGAGYFSGGNGADDLHKVVGRGLT